MLSAAQAGLIACLLQRSSLGRLSGLDAAGGDLKPRLVPRLVAMGEDEQLLVSDDVADDFRFTSRIATEAG